MTTCDGETNDVTEGLRWESDNCAFGTVTAEPDVLRIFSNASGTIQAFGEHYNEANRLPGTIGEQGFFTLDMSGELSGFSTGGSVLLVFGEGDQRRSVPVNFGPNANRCPIVVPAGEVMRFSNFFLQSSGPIDNEISLSYTFTRVQASLIRAVEVPESDLSGNRYRHNLPLGTLSLLPARSGELTIGLIENKPTAQTIDLIKSEGEVVVEGYTRIGVQRATQSGEPHTVNFYLEGVPMCLAGSELMIEDGASLRLGNTPMTYQSMNSCIGTTTNGRLSVAAGTSQQLGLEGRGMQLIRVNSVLTVEENAQLTFDGIIQPDFPTGRAYIDVMPGAEVIVTGNAIGANRDQPAITVRLHDDARFDASAARPNVQNIFEVEQVSTTPAQLEDHAFSVSPNPSPDGVLYLRNGTSSSALARVELLDPLGRVLDTPRLTQAGNLYSLEVAGSGLFFLRLTDGEGRTGTKRIVIQ